MRFWNDGNRNKPIPNSIEVNECVSIWKCTPTFDTFDSIQFQFIRKNNVFVSHSISFFLVSTKHSTTIVLQNMCISIRCMLLLFVVRIISFYFLGIRVYRCCHRIKCKNRIKIEIDTWIDARFPFHFCCCCCFCCYLLILPVVCTQTYGKSDALNCTKWKMVRVPVQNGSI